MNRSSTITGLSFVLLLSTSAVADDSKGLTDEATIPLNTIWGYNLPDTRDIAGIPLPEIDPPKGAIGRTDAMFRRERENVVEHFRRALMFKPPTERAPSGFVLPRQPDFYTLQRASNRAADMIRYGERNHQSESGTFRAGEEMTLVFFSHPASYYVRVLKVERQGDQIAIQYEFEPHASPEVTVHFALIPLGELPAGEYQVRFEQMPMAQGYRDAGFQPVHPEAFEFICRPFSFTMWEPTESTSAEDSEPIPLERVWAYQMPGTLNVRDLEARPERTDAIDGIKEHTNQSNVSKILKVLNRRPDDGETAGPAFVVLGNGKTALKNAADILSREEKASTVFPPGEDLSLVFFSHSCGRYVRLVAVEQSPGLIVAKYQFVSHATTNMSRHFAIIPLGALSEGGYQVKIEQVEPVDQQGKSAAPIHEPQRLVCGSFSFRVRKE